MFYEVAYIGAVQRSGSTLLDLLLSAHEAVVSVGEIHFLKAYALEDRRLYDPRHPLACSCGRSVSECGFWRDVGRRLPVPLSSLVLKPAVLGSSRDEHQESTPWQRGLARLVYRRPALFRSGPVFRALDGARVGADSFALFDAIAAVTGTERIIDSSKNPFRFYALYRSRPDALRLIILCRDYRAVAFSHAKRGIDTSNSVRWWAARLEQLEQLAAAADPDRVIRIRYEDLCADPDACLSDLWAFLGLEAGGVTDRRPDVQSRHHLGGSPSKFGADTQIRLDTSYQQQFGDAELERMRALAGRRAVTWGYD